MTDKDIIQDFEEIYRYETNQWSPFWEEAYKDLRFYLGDQWESYEKAYLENNFRNAFVFNRIWRLINMLTGLERKNRLSLKATPIEGSDDKTASQFTGIMSYDMRRIYPAIGKAFLGSSQVGISLVRLMIGYEEDLLSGDISAIRYAFNQFVLDSNITDATLKDCQHILTRRYVSRDAAKAMLPERAKEIDNLEAKGPDNKFDLFYDPFRYDKQDSFRYDEFWRRSYRKVKVVIDTLTGKFLVWDKGTEAEEDFRALMNVKIPTKNKGKVDRFITRDRYIPTVDHHVIIEDELFFKGKDPTGLDDYPFEAEMAYFTPEYPDLELKLQGVIRCMRDPQSEKNKRRSKMIDILDSQIASGWKVEEEATPEGFENQYYQSGQAKVIMVKEGKLSAVEKILPADIPAGLFQLDQVLDADLDQIPGGNSELFGVQEDGTTQIPGILAKMRSNAALVAFQSLFDDHRDLLSRLGKKLMRIEQLNYHPRKVQRIIGEQPTEMLYDENFSKYDCTAVEGLNSDTQRQMYYQELKELMAGGMPIPWTELLEAAPIQFKDKLKAAIKAGQEGQAKEAQAQSALDKLTQLMMQAKAAADMARAEEDKTDAMMNRVKIAQELEQGKDDRLFSLLNNLISISGGDQPDQVSATPKPKAKPTGRELVSRR